MTTRKLIYVATALVAFLALAGSAIDYAKAERPGQVDDSDQAFDDRDSDDPALDDGRALLPKAKLTFDQAEAVALAAAPGSTVDEIDLEYWNGKLIYDVDLSGKGVNVDATSGKVLSVTEGSSDND